MKTFKLTRQLRKQFLLVRKVTHRVAYFTPTIFLSLFFIALILFVGRWYLTARFPYTHDGNNHLARFANYKIALREGQFPPRFAPNLMNHYGYPVFNYNYPLANLLSVPLSVLDVSYEVTFKILVFSALLLTATGAWFLSSRFVRSPSSRMVAVTACLTAPFVISLLNYRGNIGELLAFSLLPWLFITVPEGNENKQLPVRHGILSWIQPWVGQLFTLGIWAAFLLAHNVSVVFGAPLVIFFAVISLRKKGKQLLSWCGTVGVGVLFSLWFWLPALVEKILVILDSAVLSNGFLEHFPTLNQLLFGQVQFGFSLPGSIDSMGFQLGYVFWVCLLILLATIVAGVKLRRPPSFRPEIWFFLIGSWLLIGLQLKDSNFLWKLIPILRFVQFPWRLAMFTTIFAIPLVGLAFEQSTRLGKKVIIVFLLLQIIVAAKVKPIDFFHYTNLDYDVFSQSTTTANENLPKSFTYTEIADWQPTAKILSGSGTIRVQQWNGTKRSYQITAVTPVIVAEPTMNFAGWRTLVQPKNQGTWKKVAYVDSDDIGGRLAYSVPAGSYLVTTEFTQNTWPRLLGNGIFILTATGLIDWIILQIKRSMR